MPRSIIADAPHKCPMPLLDRSHTLAFASLLALASYLPVHAQDRGTLTPTALPALANPHDPSTPAKALFGRVTAPTGGPAQPYGSYARGCFSGGEGLPLDGATWQVMRPSRNRMWGTPTLVDFVERLAGQAPRVGWSGLLVGDMSQPRGGPMLTGHASHQLGLDVDVWLTPMPDRRLSRAEREEMSATDVLRDDRRDVDASVWTPRHTALIRATAKQPEVARIFVNAAIKRALCREAGSDRGWLTKVRPMYGHNYHYHIRLACPSGADGCEDQAPPPGSDGCGDELDYWFSPAVLNPPKAKGPIKPRPPMTLAGLPSACRAVVFAR